MEHLLTTDEPVTVEVVDEEGEGCLLVVGASQEARQPADPLLQSDDAHVAAVEGAEDAVHEYLLGDHVEGVVEQLAEHHAVQTLGTRRRLQL